MHVDGFRCSSLLQNHKTFSEIERCSRWKQSKVAQTLMAKACMERVAFGSTTLRLPRAYLGSIRLSRGLLTGIKQTKICTPFPVCLIIRLCNWTQACIALLVCQRAKNFPNFISSLSIHLKKMPIASQFNWVKVVFLLGLFYQVQRLSYLTPSRQVLLSFETSFI